MDEQFYKKIFILHFYSKIFFENDWYEENILPITKNKKSSK